jgi:predicted regulator of Ras-like GTPase activity (Roadblock/LC7/MglB family)
MVCVLPEGLDCRRPAESGGALLQSARSLSERAGHGALSAILVTADAGSAFIGVGQAAGGEPVVCQIVARGVDNVGKVAMTAHKALAALKDIAIQSPGARPADAATGQAVPAGEDGFDLQGAARAAGAGLAAGLFECQTGTRLAAFGPPEAVAPDVAGSAGAVLSNATTYGEVVGLGRVHKVMLEGAGGIAALAAPARPDMPFVLLMPPSAVKLGLISVQVGKVAAALAPAASG